MNKMKLAVIFPGIGYHVDKPLLYYAKKLAISYGYEIVEVAYKNFSKDIKGNREKMLEAFQSGVEQTEEILKDIDFSKYEQILCISKSIGTAISSAYASRHQLETKNIFYTPVIESFEVIEQEGIVFHGTSDPWAKTKDVEKECEKKQLPLFKVKDANHSLETGNAIKDIKNLKKVMKKTKKYIEQIEAW